MAGKKAAPVGKASITTVFEQPAKPVKAPKAKHKEYRNNDVVKKSPTPKGRKPKNRLSNNELIGLMEKAQADQLK